MKQLAKYLNPRAISAAAAFALQPRGLVEGHLAGAHKSPFHGFSVEFAGHREYIPGDDIRHLDWRVYYRRDRYFIKQYEAETNMVVEVLLDASESMRFKSLPVSKLDWGAELAVSLAYLVTRVRDSFGIAVFDEAIQAYLPPSNSLAAVHKVNHVLEELVPKKKTDFPRIIMDFAGRIGRRRLVILISDLLIRPEELSRGLARLRYDRHEVVVFQVLDPLELGFELQGRYRFVGLEGLSEVKLNPRQVRHAYLEKLQVHLREIRNACERNLAAHVLVNTSRPLEEVLFEYLTSRLTHIQR